MKQLSVEARVHKVVDALKSLGQGNNFKSHYVCGAAGHVLTNEVRFGNARVVAKFWRIPKNYHVDVTLSCPQNVDEEYKIFAMAAWQRMTSIKWPEFSDYEDSMQITNILCNMFPRQEKP